MVLKIKFFKISCKVSNTYIFKRFKTDCCCQFCILKGMSLCGNVICVVMWLDHEPYNA